MKVVAEAGTCNGDLGYALHAAVRAQQAGAWGFKVQLLNPDTIASSDAVAYHQGLRGVPESQLEAFANQLPYDKWAKVKDICDQLGIEFFASCWDEEAVDACVEMGVNYFKVGSGDITNRPLLEHTAKTGKHIILSTGASSLEEINQAILWMVNAAGTPIPLTLLACTLSYPALWVDANLGRILTLKQAFPTLDVGYSNHTRGHEAAYLAAAYGAAMFETHFSVTLGAGGDHDFAAGSAVLSKIVEIGRSFAAGIGDGALSPMPVETDARLQARRSLYARRDIPKGKRLEKADLIALRPGTGIPPADMWKIVDFTSGKSMRAMIAIPAGTQLTWPMIGFVGATLTVG